jgi:hypothetical protein
MNTAYEKVQSGSPQREVFGYFRDGTNLCSSARRPGGAIADCRQEHCAAQSTREAIETRLRLHASRGPQDTIAGQAPSLVAEWPGGLQATSLRLTSL